MDDTPPVLRLSGITKRFGPVVANDEVSLELRAGEVLALLGENGAGKSTLVSILFGHYVADAGSIEVDGLPLPPGQPRAALAAGIGMVHQHFALADNLTVLENVVLGTESAWRPFMRLDRARTRIVALSSRFGLAVPVDARVAQLSVGERQRVEILKALYRGARILILDEPTAVLTPQESESLFETLAGMVRQGLSIVFISHKLGEVLRVSDRVAVLRGGRLVATARTADTTRHQLAEWMVGSPVRMPARTARPRGAAMLRLSRVTVRGSGRDGGKPRLQDIDLDVHAGEIVAIAGVSGNGQAVLADLLCGLVAPAQGDVVLADQPMPARAAEWVAAGVARIPEDRHGTGVVGDLSLWENAVMERLDEPAFSRAGWLRRGAARRFAAGLVQRFDVRGGGLDVPARALSGGNMQKLVLGRALSLGARSAEGGVPRLIVASQPTWGLDVGAVAYVHGLLLEAAAAGAAVLLVSEDLDEVRSLADRIAVMHAGRLTPALPAEEWTLAALGLAMAGAAATTGASTSAATAGSDRDAA